MSLDVVDVVVVAYESAEHLSACLDSVPAGAPTVVIDNASSDASPAVAAAMGAQVVRNLTNRGFAAAANQGAALGDSDLVLFLNPDARIAPPDLSKLIDALRSDPSVAVAGPRLVHPDGSEQRPWWPYPSASRSWLEAFGLHRLVPHADRRDVPFVVGACFLVRRSVFDALGGFDESFWLYGEEADLCRRAVSAGWRVRYVPEAVSTHVGGASAEAAGAKMVSEQFCLGTDRFVHKHGGRMALASHRLALLAGSAVRVAALAATGRPRHPTAVERRRLVRRQLRVLASAPASLPPDPAGERNESDGVVVCSLEAWDDTWRRNQFLVRELMARDPRLRVLFVEPATDVLHDLAQSHRVPRETGLRQLTPDGRLWALAPRKVLPRALGGWADASLIKQVRAAAAVLGMDRPTLWVNDSAYAGLMRATRWPTLYDITDDWLEAPCLPREKRRRHRRERLMLADAGVVTVCSPALLERRGGDRPVHLIPNAVDAAHFSRARPRPVDLPDGSCAVYVGTLHDGRLDVDLLADLARSLRHVHVVLVGPDALSEYSRARLAGEPNIHVLGPRPYDDVPGYLQHADLIIVPHVLNAFTESLDPIKAYEILAVGRPAVVTPVAGLRDLGRPVTCAEASGFVDAVRAVLADPPDRCPQPVASWSDRAKEFDAALDDARTTQRPLSVVYLDHCAQLSGGELALLRLLPALEGVAPHVILAEDGPLRSRLEEEGLRCEVIVMAERARGVKRARVVPGGLPVGAVLDSVRYVMRLRGRLRELKPDLVHTNSLKAGVYGSVSARLAGIPVIWHVRDRISDDYLPGSAVPVLRGLIRCLPDAVVTNSEATLACLGKVPHATVVPSPVAAAERNGAVSQAINSPRAPFRAGIVGRLAPWKGQDVFLRAFAEAFASGDEVAIIVGAPLFGEDAYGEELRRLADNLGIAERVEFTGFRDDVAHLLATLDVFVHASTIPEPFGQVVVEAMSAGVPVIAAAAGGPLEIVGEEEFGLLHPPGDVAGLARALRRVRDDQALRTRLGVDGVVRARDFSPDVVAAKMLSVYASVLAEPGRGARATARTGNCT